MDVTEKRDDLQLRDPFFTRTMAELMEKQGHLDDALIIYKMLQKRFPENGTIRAGVERLEEKAKIFLSRHKRGAGRNS